MSVNEIIRVESLIKQLQEIHSKITSKTTNTKLENYLHKMIEIKNMLAQNTPLTRENKENILNVENILKNIDTAKTNIQHLDKFLGLNKMTRFLLFVFMFFFIFKTIDHILDFFDVNKEMGYIYFVWFTLMFLLFVILPIRRSILSLY